MLFQQLVNRMCSHCLFPACWQVVNGLLSSCNSTINLSTSCEWQSWTNLITALLTALLQLVDKLATSLLRTHLVDKLWDFYTCVVKYLLTGRTFGKQYMWVVQVKTKRYAQHAKNVFFCYFITNMMSIDTVTHMLKKSFSVSFLLEPLTYLPPTLERLRFDFHYCYH
jgi:hypothetical protein